MAALVGALALLPALRRLPSSFQEYPAGLSAKWTALRDALWVVYFYEPPRIHLASETPTEIAPFRIDERRLAGMGECASIGENSRGVVLSAYMMRDPRDKVSYKVYGRRLRSDGTFVSHEFRINTGASAALLNHHVSLKCGEHEDFWVLWHAATYTGDGLVRNCAGPYLAHFDADAKKIGEEVRVSPSPSGGMAEMSHPVQGHFYVVWSDCGKVLLRQIDSKTGAMGEVVTVGKSGEFPVIAEGADGKVLVGWADQSTRGARYRLLSPTLRPLTPTFSAGEGAIPSVFFRLLAACPVRDGFLLCWNGKPKHGTRGCLIDLMGNASTFELLPAQGELSLLPLPDGSAIASNCRDFRHLDRGQLGTVLTLIPPPSVPCELSMALGNGGVWLTWHEAIDMRKTPGQGDNLYIMAAKLPQAAFDSKRAPAD